MRMRLLFAAILSFFCPGVARAGIDGSVFLFPIENGGSFASYGECVYVNAVNEVDPETVFSGTHSVHGPQIFEHAITGTGRYQYLLEGPAEPGACYGTTMDVTADPPGLWQHADGNVHRQHGM